MYNGWIGSVTLARKRHLEEVIVMRWIPKLDPKLVFCVYSNLDWMKKENLLVIWLDNIIWERG